MTRRHAPVLLVVGLVGLAAGCSGGSDDSTAGDGTAVSGAQTSVDATDSASTTSVTSDPATTDDAAPTTTDDGVTATTSTSGTDADPPEEVFTGDAGSAWCGISRDLDAADTDFDEVDFTDPAAVEEAITTMREQLALANDDPPPEIADEVQTVVDTFAALDEELAAVDYDFLEADLSVLDGAGNDSQSASDRIASYNEQVCGIARDDDDPDSADGGDFDPGAGTIRDQSIGQLVALGFTADEAGCLFDGLDFTDPELATQYDTILAVFDDCDIDPTRLADLGAG